MYVCIPVSKILFHPLPSVVLLIIFQMFFIEIQTNGSGGIGTNSQNASNRSEILYMSAVLGRLTNQLPDQVLTLLNEAVDAHFK